MVMSEEKKIIRTPIYINKNAVAVIHIFTKNDEMRDIWMSDFWRLTEESYERHSDAAKQFVSQLKDEWFVAFMNALIEECLEEVDGDGKRCNIDRSGELFKKLADKYGFDFVKKKEPASTVVDDNFVYNLIMANGFRHGTVGGLHRD